MENYIWIAVLVVVALTIGVLMVRKRMPRQPSDPALPSSWTANIYQRDHVKDEPRIPVRAHRDGLVVNIPTVRPTLNSLTHVSGPISADDTHLRIRFRIEGGPVVTDEIATRTGRITPFMQRRGDNWSGVGKYLHYRWFGIQAYRIPMTPGEYEIYIPFTPDAWRSIMGAPAEENLDAFINTLADVENIGLALGGGSGAAHGVLAVDPARIIVTYANV